MPIPQFWQEEGNPESHASLVLLGRFHSGGCRKDVDLLNVLPHADFLGRFRNDYPFSVHERGRVPGAAARRTRDHI